MRSLLMLAFEFPPLTTVGAQRPLKLAKYLPAHGITPLIVTTDAASMTQWFGRPLDAAAPQELPADAVVHRIASPRPPIPQSLLARRLKRAMSLDDEDIGRHWEPPLLEQWDRLVSETRASALYATAPPFSVLPLAVRLAKRSRLPLILDFRDAWSQWCHSPRPSALHYRLVLREERRCLEAACAIVTTTAQMALEMQAVHPHIPRDRFTVIPNGFEGSIPPHADTLPPRPFVIGYVGGFYYLPQMRASVMQPWWQRSPLHWLHYSPRQEDWLYRTPYFFFRALAGLLRRRPDLRSGITVRFAGDREPWLQDQISEFGLEDVVELIGRLTLDQSLKFQSSCNALLSTSAKVIGGRDQFIAGKTFEYVAAGRPVVAFVSEGEQKDFWRESGVAMICDPDDPVSAAAALERLVEGGFTPDPNLAFLRRFERQATAGRLADLVASCAQ